MLSTMRKSFGAVAAATAVGASVTDVEAKLTYRDYKKQAHSAFMSSSSTGAGMAR